MPEDQIQEKPENKAKKVIVRKKTVSPKIAVKVTPQAESPAPAAAPAVSEPAPAAVEAAPVAAEALSDAQELEAPVIIPPKKRPGRKKAQSVNHSAPADEATPAPEKEIPAESAEIKTGDSALAADSAPASETVAQTVSETAPAAENAPVAEASENAGDGAASENADDRQNGGRNNRYQNNNPRDKRNKDKNFQKNQIQKKVPVTYENVSIPTGEFEALRSDSLVIGSLSPLGMDALKEKLCALTGNSADVYSEYKKQELINDIVRAQIVSGGAVIAKGTLEVMQEGGQGSYGFLRSPQNSYMPGGEDVYVSSMFIRFLNLKTGDTIEGVIRSPKENNDKYYAISKIAYVNDDEPIVAKTRQSFDSLTPLYPEERINLEVPKEKLPHLSGLSADGASSDVSMRIINMFCPIGKGQRALITAPPRTGKTIFLQQIANSITTNHPEVYLMVLLVDERPEEVTDMKRNVKGEVIASTFDEQASRHVQVAQMVIEKAKRLVEHKRDVVILLDSITRLARAYNQTEPASGKVLSGGVDSNALHKPKRFFGAARNIEEGGSLTIIASALIETGSRMDEVIFEEFKGTGNCELVLDRRMADRRVYPAINIKKSGTRREELLLDKDEAARIWILRNAINNLEDLDMTEFLIDKIRKSPNNELFLRSMNTGVKFGV